MPCINKSQLDDIIDFEIAIKKMYLKLANLEYEGKLDTDEYRNIIGLLLSAKRIEKSKFDKIKLDSTVCQRISDYFSRNDDKIDFLKLLNNQDYIESIRLNNILGILIMQNNYFLTDEELKYLAWDPDFQDDLANRQYLESYENGTTLNFIYVLNEDIDKMPSKELRKYFIYLKYFNIYINPTYENHFISSNGILKHPINIGNNKYQVPYYSQEHYDCCNQNNLTNEIIDDLTYILKSDYKDFKSGENKLELYHILSLNKSKLISLQDKSFISLIYSTLTKIAMEDPNLQGMGKMKLYNKIDNMFVESYKLLDTIEEKRKLELKG